MTVVGTRAGRLTLLVCISTALVSCSFPVGSGGGEDASQVLVRANRFTLEWDCTAYGPDTCIRPIDSYHVYYRRRGRAFWTLLAEIDGGAERAFTVTGDVLPPGQYEFSVRNIYSDGRMSPLHSSTDFGTEPPGGWYVNWIPTY